MRVRKAKQKDILELIKIGKDIKEFDISSEAGGFWPKEILKEWINSKNDVILIAEENEKIIGFVMFSFHKPTKKATWENAWVSKEFQNRGIATKLMKEAIEILKKNGMKYICSLIKEDSKKSIKLHEKNNFKKGYKFWWFYKIIK